MAKFVFLAILVLTGCVNNGEPPRTTLPPEVIPPDVGELVILNVTEARIVSNANGRFVVGYVLNPTKTSVVFPSLSVEEEGAVASDGGGFAAFDLIGPGERSPYKFAVGEGEVNLSSIRAGGWTRNGLVPVPMEIRVLEERGATLKLEVVAADALGRGQVAAIISDADGVRDLAWRALRAKSAGEPQQVMLEIDRDASHQLAFLAAGWPG